MIVLLDPTMTVRVTGVVPHSEATYTGVWLEPDERTAIVLLDEIDVPPAAGRLWRIDLVTGATAPGSKS